MTGRRILAILLGVAMVLSSGPVAPAAAASGTNCRFGITAPLGVAGHDLAALGVGAYLDWGMRADPAAFGGVEYVQVVRLRDSARRFVLDPEVVDGFRAALQAVAEARPGSAWLIGNEPDTAYENQDALTPDEYAQGYHEAHAVLKAADPSARIGIGTIVQPTPLRLRWLELMWSAYQAHYGTPPPSDFWSIHSFILRERAGDWGTGIPPGLEGSAGAAYTIAQTDSLPIFRSRILAFRRWMAAKGERGKPLWISEYGSLLPTDPSHGYATLTVARTRAFMRGTFDYLLRATDPSVGYPADGDRLVQRWFWYSLNDHAWKMGGGLFDPDSGAETELGQAFRAYIAASPRAADLRPVTLAASPIAPGEVPAVTLTATVANSGSVALAGGFAVTFYDGDPARGGPPIGASQTVPEDLPGCGGVRTAMVTWEAVTAGRRSVYVRVDPSVPGDDASPSNNLRRFTIVLAP